MNRVPVDISDENAEREELSPRSIANNVSLTMYRRPLTPEHNVSKSTKYFVSPELGIEISIFGIHSKLTDNQDLVQTFWLIIHASPVGQHSIRHLSLIFGFMKFVPPFQNPLPASNLHRHVLERVVQRFLAERKLADSPDLGVLHSARG